MGLFLGTTKIASGGVNFDDIYPVGSVYISISGQKPTYGTWVKLSEGRCLWNTASGGGGDIAQALPKPLLTFTGSEVTTSSAGNHTHNRGDMNIAGSFDSIGVSDGGNGVINCAGAFSGPTGGGAGGYSTQWTGTSYGWSRVSFNANRNWSGNTSEAAAHTHTVTAAGTVTCDTDVTYGTGSVVQPPAIAVTMFKRTA